MPRPSEQEMQGRLTATLEDWGAQLPEKADADEANDRAILAAINRAIELQTGDNDSPSDAKVMAALREAKTAQEADMREG